jgi:hypothetical protein
MEKTNDNRVMKELTGEEMSLISNIGSLVQEILAQTGGGAAGGAAPAPAAPAQAQMAAEAPALEKPEDEEGRTEAPPSNATKPIATMKELTTGQPDASTANSTAEEKIKDIPEWDEENLEDVVKAIVRMAAGNGVKKTVQTNPLVAGLTAMANALAAVAKSQQEQGRVLNDLLEGMGVAQAFEQETVRKSAAIQTSPADQSNVVKELTNAILKAAGQGANGQGFNGEGDTRGMSQSEIVHKSMGDLVLGLGRIAGSKWNPDLGQ